MLRLEKIDLGLRSVDDLFTTEEQREDDKREKILDIPINELHLFMEHPFHVEDNDELRELARSIADHGVVTPAIARSLPDSGRQASLCKEHSSIRTARMINHL